MQYIFDAIASLEPGLSTHSLALSDCLQQTSTSDFNRLVLRNDTFVGAEKHSLQKKVLFPRRHILSKKEIYKNYLVLYICQEKMGLSSS